MGVSWRQMAAHGRTRRVPMGREENGKRRTAKGRARNGPAPCKDSNRYRPPACNRNWLRSAQLQRKPDLRDEGSHPCAAGQDAATVVTRVYGTAGFFQVKGSVVASKRYEKAKPLLCSPILVFPCQDVLAMLMPPHSETCPWRFPATGVSTATMHIPLDHSPPPLKVNLT